MPIVTNIANRQKIHINQSHIRCGREGFSSLESSITTAIFGKAKDSIPGKRLTIVNRIAPCNSSIVRVWMCRPLPECTAVVENPTPIHPQIYSTLVL